MALSSSPQAKLKLSYEEKHCRGGVKLTDQGFFLCYGCALDTMISGLTPWLVGRVTYLLALPSEQEYRDRSPQPAGRASAHCEY